MQKKVDALAQKKQQEKEAQQEFFSANAQKTHTQKKSQKDKKTTKLDGGHQKLPERVENTPAATEGSDANA